MSDPIKNISSASLHTVETIKNENVEVTRSESMIAHLGGPKKVSSGFFKRFFSSISHGFVFLGEKISSLFSKAKTGEPPKSRLNEIKNSNANISNESIIKGEVKVPKSPEKLFNQNLYNNLLSGNFDKLPEEYLEIIKATDEKFSKLQPNYEPIEKKGSDTCTMLNNALHSLVVNSEEKISPETFAKFTDRYAVNGALKANKEIENFMIKENGGPFKGGTPKSILLTTVVNIEENAKKGDPKSEKFVQLLQNIESQEDYEQFLDSLKKDFLVEKIAFKKQISNFLDHAYEQIKTRTEEVFNQQVNTNRLKEKVRNIITHLTGPDQLKDAEKKIGEAFDKFIGDRQAVLDEVNSLTSDPDLKEIWKQEILKEEQNLKPGEYTKLHDVADSMKAEKSFNNLIKLAKSSKIPDSKKIYKAFTEVTHDMLSKVSDLHLSKDGVDAEGDSLSFILRSLVQEFPVLKNCSKFMESFYEEQNKNHGGNAAVRESEVARLAFAFVFDE